MLRAKQERSPKPMLLTFSLSGWHKEVAKHFRMPTLAVVSKGPRSVQLRGPFALPGLRHDISLLANEDCFKGIGDGFLTRFEPTSPNGAINRISSRLGDPNIHFSISPLTTEIPKTLNS
jgi:hypothetical protein